MSHQYLYRYAQYRVFLPSGVNVILGGTHFIFYPDIREWLDREDLVFGSDWSVQRADDMELNRRGGVFFFSDRVNAIRFALRWK